jgi:hypothetical protein
MQEYSASICNGLKNACIDSIRFNGFDFPDIKPEYLITVNVAQSIKSSFPELVLRLEESTSVVTDKCLLNEGDIFAALRARNSFAVEREGRIDIVLYDSAYKERVLGILEIKGFNIDTTVLLLDVARICDFLRAPSNIESGAVAFLQQDKKCYLVSQMDEGIQRNKEKYSKIIQTAMLNTSFEFTVHCETVHENNLMDSFTDLNGMEDADIADRLSECAHYVGIVIVVSRKN